MPETPIKNQNDGVLRLRSPIPVSVNHYLVPKVIYPGGTPRATMYETNEAKRYKKQFALYTTAEIRNQKWMPPEDKRRHFYMDCVFYFDRIDRDPNNYFKLLCDAITDSGQVWPDDNVVCERVQGIYYDSKDPRIEIEIRPVDYIGIFVNEIEKERFTEVCKTCNRFEKNCSILRKCIEGRMTPEVNSGVCDKYKSRKDHYE